MAKTVSRREALRLAAGAIGISVLAACSPPAPAPKTETQPAGGGPQPTQKPAEAAKPAEAVKPATSGTAAAAPAAGSNLAKINFGIIGYNPLNLVAVVASQKPEFYRKHGLEVDMVTTGSAPAALQALAAGSLNLTAATPESAWPVQDKTDVMQIMANINGSPYALIVNPKIKSVAELKGKPVGASALRAGADITAMRLILLENGLKEGDYSVIVAGQIAERTSALKAETIMAVAQLEPQVTQLKDDGYMELDHADNYPVLKNIQSGVFLSRRSWYEPNMDAMVNYVKAFSETTRWVYDPKNKDEIIDIMSRTMNVQAKAANNAYERRVIKSKTPPTDPHVSVEMQQQMIENQRKIGTENLPTDLSKLIDNRIVDRAMA